MVRGRVQVGIAERARRSRALLRSGLEVNCMALIAWGPVAIMTVHAIRAMHRVSGECWPDARGREG